MAREVCNEYKIDEITLALEKNNHNHGIFERLFSGIGGVTSSNQMMVGMSVGWMSGFCALKIGRPTIMALGGGLILLQIAIENDVIKIDWERVNDNFERKKGTNKQEKENTLIWLNKIARFAEKYTSFSSGFLGGFLIGLAAH